MSRVFLVMATTGAYEDHDVWVWSAHSKKDAAELHVHALTQAARDQGCFRPDERYLLAQEEFEADGRQTRVDRFTGILFFTEPIELRTP